METILQLLASFIMSALFANILIPVLSIIAVKVNLTDKPNERKIHSTPIPLVGGAAVVFTMVFCSLFLNLNLIAYENLSVVVNTSVALFILGLLDDKLDINARYKFVFELFMAYLLSSSGLRITSLYGLFGIHDIPLIFQYVLTIVVVCGVVNAFNLMDGVNGLAGALSIVGLMMFAVFAVFLKDFAATSLCLTLVGSLVGFLKYNVLKGKVFMGDAGSLFLGNILSGIGLYLINQPACTKSDQPVLITMIIGFFAVPLLDSIRVYLGRMKKGKSPFKADRSHLHHLLLLMKLSHKKVTTIISILTVIMILFSLTLYFVSSISLTLFSLMILFSLIGLYLNTFKKLSMWMERLKKYELENPAFNADDND